MLTNEEFRSALPDKIRKNVNQEVIDKINLLLADPDMRETYRDNLLSYGHVMKDGKFKITQYIDAVKYVSHKVAGKTNLDAYSLTFPDKVQDWASRGVSEKDVSSYVSIYNKSKLVNLILEQTLTPSWILNQDMYQKALNTQAWLMTNAKSEMVRTNAANSILTQLKQPETQKLQLDIGIKPDSSIDQLRKSTMELVEQQKLMIRSGSMSAQEIAHSRVVVDNDTGDVE